MNTIDILFLTVKECMNLYTCISLDGYRSTRILQTYIRESQDNESFIHTVL